MPLGPRRDPSTLDSRPSTPSGPECLVIEFASRDSDQPPPKLYVPVTEAHLVGKYVGAGKARPPLNTLGGTRWARAKEQAERAVRDVAAELLSIQAARELQPGHAFSADTAWQPVFVSTLLVVSHYSFWSAGWEMTIAWHNMIAPYDWTEVHLRQRGVDMAPSLAFRIDSVSESIEPHEVAPPEAVVR